MPGDGINGVFEALRKNKDRIPLHHVRHEKSAAFAACAMPNSRGVWACASQLRGPGEFSFSTAPFKSGKNLRGYSSFLPTIAD
jgi:thiamine pyrophosphate-dependent acetolactate synthase large subunit-like protein